MLVVCASCCLLVGVVGFWRYLANCVIAYIVGVS